MRANHLMIPDILLNFGAGALIFGGILLLLRAYWMGEEALARHIQLVSGFAKEPALRTGAIKSAPSALNAYDDEIARRLRAIGVPVPLARWISRWIRPMIAVLASTAGLAAGPHVPLLSGSKLSLIGAGLLAGVVGWMLPNALVRRWRRHRIGLVVRGLPEALELLVICVEAGLSLEQSISKAVAELHASQPALAEEFALTLADLQLSPNQEEALMGLARRVDAPVMRSVVSTLCQTMKYGTPLSQTIRFLASDMRTEMLLKIEERANRLPVLMTIPMMVFILPTIVFVVVGPAALTLIDTYLH
jgi:tight adherence protein C